MPRLLFAIFAAFLAVLPACGLSLAERAVTQANAAIEGVREASEDVASAIHALPDRTLQRDDFATLRTAVDAYIGRVEALNAALRELGTHYTALQPHLDGAFRTASAGALESCQSALDALDGEASTEEDFRRALTRVGLCLDRYATAVTNVSAEYTRLAE
jgi:hypothetical protein